MLKVNTIEACQYHRNGICGVGFHVVDFTWEDDFNIAMTGRAIIFANGEKRPTHYAITTKDPAERWRGDHFIDVLWPHVERAIA